MLEARSVGHHHQPGRWLFRGVDLDVRPGEVVAVLGPNARGKTTLLTCLAGLRRPREGSVVHTGVVGYVPQTHAAEHAFSAREMVVMGRTRTLRAWSSPGKKDEAAAMAALDRVGLADRSETPFAALSGGQRQLVLMARALVGEPATLILDEPTSALDLRNQRRVLSVVAQLAADGMGVLLTTHDPTHALHAAGTTVLMDEDIRVGPSAELLTADLLSRLYRTPVVTADVEFASGRRRVVVPDLRETEDAA